MNAASAPGKTYGPRRDPGISYEAGGAVHNCECGHVRFYPGRDTALVGRRRHLKTCPAATPREDTADG